ncbi:ATP-binding cassette domain-containing protein [Candidatus Mycobacterium methanotrophicum]|uniref:ABC transporter domain-containing protein n=1 Tax=Candidatus Mycobacterium methanotrophicum TaxID=2943498 RepID=A0ABY4QQ52_9MYCO|nr:ATP-binding cassette domain-containing protein [Candidatus Mycobacterium methanotrophicum]UQX11898.1 hypothetical protein M5I08_05745 [Candidatus Mycobacterium methanotrophicum]
MEFEGVQIAARGISVRGPRGCAFANVSLDVAAAQLAVVAGQAGSGRTALLLALAGRMRLVTGTVAVGRYRLPGDSRRVQQLVAVAAAPPAVDLDEFLRVDEHVAERAVFGRARAPAVSEALDVLGFVAAGHSRVGELRASDRVLLAAALAAAERPAAIVIDDVDSGCGPAESRRVWSGLSALAELGCTVVASSTDIPEALDQIDIAVTPLPHPFGSDPIPGADGGANR